MVITNSKACWYCLKKTMETCSELGAGWYKCSKCGATEIEMPEFLPFVLAGTWRDHLGMEHQSPHPVSRKEKAKK